MFNTKADQWRQPPLQKMTKAIRHLVEPFVITSFVYVHAAELGGVDGGTLETV